MSTQTLIWLFIVAFMLHDLEEIIWVESWLKKNKDDIIHHAPNRIKKSLEKMFNITSGQFAVAVLLELIIFIPFTYLAAEHEMYFVFMSFNALFFLHIFTHVGQSLYLKRYTPGVVTSVIVALPYTLYLYNQMLGEELVSWNEVLLSIPVGLLLVPIVLLGHELGRKLVK